jgi:hypothetical protein
MNQAACGKARFGGLHMKKFLLLLAGLLLLTGCVPVDSLNPLYTDKDTAFDESLLGSWVGSDNGADGVLEFIARDEDGKKTYLLVMTDKDKESDTYKRTIYQAHFVKLNDGAFLDVTPQTFETSLNSYPLQVKSGKRGTTIEPALLRLGEAAYMEFSPGAHDGGGKIDAHIRRAHWIVRVTRKDKVLQLDWADDDVFRKAVQAGTMKLPSKLLGDKGQNVVITATTQELQKFVVEHAEGDEFFNSKAGPLHRKE